MSVKRVLLVDDEEDLTWTMSRHLAKDRDQYEVYAVNSGPAALEILSQLPFQLVISDIRMPEMSGLDLLMRIREDYPATKVIIMTAYGSSEIQDEANKRGCFKYIEKPFEINEMRQLILNSLTNKQGFEGQIKDLHLADLIQMSCLGRLNNALSIDHAGDIGVIYFNDGEIIHAHTAHSEGEEAFYEIITWEGGNFSISKEARPSRESIMKGWQSLLLEGLRRADELRSHENEQAIPVDNRHLEVKRMIKELVESNKVELVSLFDSGGFPLASHLDQEFATRFQLSEISGSFAMILKDSQIVGNDFEAGKQREIYLEYEQGILAFFRIGLRQEFLIVFVQNAANWGPVRLAAKQLVKKLAIILS